MSRYEGKKIFMDNYNIDLLKQNKSFDNDLHKYYLMCEEFVLRQLMNGPTHNNLNLLDHIHVDGKDLFQQNGHFYFAGSDHDLCYVGLQKFKAKIPPQLIKYRNMTDKDEEKFRTNLET